MQVSKRDSELKKQLSGVLKLSGKTSRKSNVQKTFSIVVDAVPSEPHGFVQCDMCRGFLTNSGCETACQALIKLGAN